MSLANFLVCAESACYATIPLNKPAVFTYAVIKMLAVFKGSYRYYGLMIFTDGVRNGKRDRTVVWGVFFVVSTDVQREKWR